MILIENGTPVAQFSGNDVELWVPESIEDFLKEFFLVELVQGYRQTIAEDMIYLRIHLCNDKVWELKSAMLQALFMTDLVNLNSQP